MTIYLRCLLVDGMAKRVPSPSSADHSFTLAYSSLCTSMMFDAIRSIESARGFFRLVRYAAASFSRHSYSCKKYNGTYDREILYVLAGIEVFALIEAISFNQASPGCSAKQSFTSQRQPAAAAYTCRQGCKHGKFV